MGILGDLGGSESNAKECQRRYDASVVFTFIVGALCDQHVAASTAPQPHGIMLNRSKAYLLWLLIGDFAV